jgi:hypothetical protein
MTVSWQLTEIGTSEYINQVFGYKYMYNYFEKTSSKGKLGAYFKYEKH